MLVQKVYLSMTKDKLFKYAICIVKNPTSERIIVFVVIQFTLCRRDRFARANTQWAQKVEKSMVLLYLSVESETNQNGVAASYNNVL